MAGSAPALDAREREEIRVGIIRGDTDDVIGGLLGRHRATINREINRNGGRRRYRAEAAQARAEKCRERPKIPKLVADPALALEVERRLEAKDSPKRISLELAQDGVSICHETIYQAIYEPDRGLKGGLQKHLHLKRRKRRPRKGYRPPGSNSLGIYCSIHSRPQVATERTEVGHFEGDLIVGKANKSALITLFDRTSRYLLLGNVKSKRADDVYTGLCKLLRQIPPPFRRTLTWAQGAELARHPQIALRCGIEIYIADPKSPWQRPTNENGNAIVRRYVGKGTDLNIYTTRQIRHIQNRVNTIPRPALNWQTAQQIYTQAVAPTT